MPLESISCHWYKGCSPLVNCWYQCLPMDTTNSYHFWTRVKLALVSHVVSQFQDGNLTTNANREGLSGTSFSITINY